jgi:hypothetical protein
MKKLSFFLFPFALLLQSCSSNIVLSRTPSDLVLLSIKPNDAAVAKYTFDSKVTNPYEYKYSGYSYVFDINSAYKNNLDTYIRTKFANTDLAESISDSIYSLEFTLYKFDVIYDYEQSTNEVILSVLGEAQGTGMVAVEMMINVKIMKGTSIVAERNLPANSQYDEKFDKNSDIGRLYSKAVNDAISKSLIIIDKFLVSNNI